MLRFLLIRINSTSSIRSAVEIGKPLNRGLSELGRVGTQILLDTKPDQARSAWGGEKLLSGKHLLPPKCPAEFYRDDITLWHDARLVRTQDQSLPSAVPDDKQVIARLDGPAQTRICAHILRFGVVLNEAAEHQIGVPSVGTLQLPQTLDEVALGKVPEIIFDVGFKLHSAFWRCPLQIVLPLR